VYSTHKTYETVYTSQSQMWNFLIKNQNKILSHSILMRTEHFRCILNHNYKNDSGWRGLLIFLHIIIHERAQLCQNVKIFFSFTCELTIQNWYILYRFYIWIISSLHVTHWCLYIKYLYSVFCILVHLLLNICCTIVEISIWKHNLIVIYLLNHYKFIYYLPLTAVGSNPDRDYGFFHVRKLSS
jgi:hypothetical protein